MTKETYVLLEKYMHTCMEDSAHDKEHVYRVLYNALEIAKAEGDIDYDVLITACLLHDIGRKEQFENPKLCHATVGSEKAFAFLKQAGFSEDFARQVSQCILTHRFRKSCEPQTLEAKILFDADKLDGTGAIGIARTLLYQGKMTHPLYLVLPDGSISNGEADPVPSFFQEYNFKLKKLYDRFYTAEGVRLAQERRFAAEAFYHGLFREVSINAADGRSILQGLFSQAAE